jgi:exodeoxyribonuclease VII small subunit
MVKKIDAKSGGPGETLKPVADLSFEEAVRELETMVSRLESTDLALADSLEAYQRGAQLLKHAQGILAHVETEIELIESRMGASDGEAAARTMDRNELIASTRSTGKPGESN